MWESGDIMDQAKGDLKTARILHLYRALMENGFISKSEAAQNFHVTQRSVQRDIEDLRCFFAEQSPHQELIYDPDLHVYRLDTASSQFLDNSEILAVCKILLESRSMVKEEMLPILDKLVARCIPAENKKAVTALIANEKHHYVAPHHGQSVLQDLWEIGQAIQRQQLVEITYSRLKAPHEVTRLIEPVGIMFSEYYFYLTAFLRNVDKATEFENEDDLFPTIYRIDRIKRFAVQKEHFQIPYKARFEEGEFRKRIQFMYGGKLEKIKFKYTGSSIEAVLDRLPTAEIIEQDDSGWTVTAEVFGKGIEMWLRSQGEHLTTFTPII